MLKNLNIWHRREDGVVAVEFALLALPFLMLLLGVLELSFYYASATVLEGAAQQAARQIRTGQVQTSGNPETTFRNLLCDRASVLMKGNCANIQYEVININNNTFAGADNYTPTFDANGNLVPTGFNTGGSSAVVLIRAVYKYKFLMPFISTMVTGSAGKDWATLVSTVVLKAEPYQFGAGNN